MKKILILVISLSLASTSCKKENTSGCWACHDNLNNSLQTVCGDNEQDAFNKTGTFMGGHNIDTFRKYCPKK